MCDSLIEQLKLKLQAQSTTYRNIYEIFKYLFQVDRSLYLDSSMSNLKTKYKKIIIGDYLDTPKHLYI